MSKEQFVDYVTVNGQQYMISTVNTFDRGLETMVFESRNFKITNWFDVYVRHYDTWQEAIDGHQDIFENLEKYLYEDEYNLTLEEVVDLPYGTKLERYDSDFIYIMEQELKIINLDKESERDYPAINKDMVQAKFRILQGGN